MADDQPGFFRHVGLQEVYGDEPRTATCSDRRRRSTTCQNPELQHVVIDEGDLLHVRTQNPEPRTPNPEPRTPNPELRTQNSEPRTQNPEPQTKPFPSKTQKEKTISNPR